MHWAAKYIGKKWVSGARGPLEFDCWGLLWHVKREHFGQDLPAYPGLDAFNLTAVSRVYGSEVSAGRWQRLERPAEGCAVGMAKRATGFIHHVGLWTESDGGLVVHAVDRANVIAQTLACVKASGFGRIEFFEYGAHYRNQ